MLEVQGLRVYGLGRDFRGSGSGFWAVGLRVGF